MKHFRISLFLTLTLGVMGSLPGRVQGIELRRHIEFALKAEMKGQRQIEVERELQTAQTLVFDMPMDNTWVKLIQDGSTPFSFSGQWTWNVPDPVRLTVTDWLWSGDWFEVYDNGVMLGEALTSGVPNYYAAEPAGALGKPNQFSQNTWILAPGLHTISIRSIQKAPTFSDATVAFQAQRVSVPEGGTTLGMFGLSLAGLASLHRGRRLDTRAVPAN